MTDIVERLRKDDGRCPHHVWEMCKDAANCIESLRERVRLLEVGIKAEKDLSRSLLIELRAKK